MNFTILSLSIFSVYSFSPLIVGENNHLYKLSFHNYFVPTFTLNPEKLLIEKSVFSRGIGSIIYSDHIGNSLKEEVPEFIGKDFTNSNIEDLNPPNAKSLIVVRDCNFIKIQYANLDDGKNSNENKIDNYLIKILDQTTFYMTNCLFDSCYFNKSILFLESRATTISHICCNNLHGGQDGEALFIRSNSPRGSFLKFIYSTFFGNYEYFPTKGIFYMGGTCALRYQCVNTSNFILSSGNDRYIARIESTSCLSMLMNTFCHNDAQHVLLINIHDGSADGRYNHYCGLTNFYDNKHQSTIIYLDMQGSTRITIDQCYFADSNVGNNGEKVKNTNGGAKIYISNCVFRTKLDTSELQNCDKIDLREYVTDLQTMTLAHYTYLNKCDATYVIDAFGCQNDTCPDDKGCQTFGFGDGDVVYTEVFHPDINTPTPSLTKAFTISFVFSYSADFSESNSFSFSDRFSKSNMFTESVDFSNSKSFSATDRFSISSKFTMSTLFSKSDQFSESNSFSFSQRFTESKQFSYTSDFTVSYEFTGSQSFSFSKKFTKSEYFSESTQFSSSFYFTKTGEFSETGKFSKTGEFSKSALFSESKDFTNSNSFAPTADFNSTHTFTPSKYFTKSNEFNSSLVFTKSNQFSNTEQFSGTTAFTQSTRFTESTLFTDSFHFTASKNFDATGTFTASDTFTPSSKFTKSDFFTSSGTFTKSNVFTQSLLFSMSSVFPNSKSFSPSNTILKNVEIVINTSKSQSKWKVIGGVIGAVAGAALIAAIILGILLMRNRKREQSSDMFEELNTVEDKNSSVTYNNALRDLDMEDDPFQDDFLDFNN